MPPNSNVWKVVTGRMVPYWLTVVMSLWILAFWYAATFEDSYGAYEQAMAMQMLGGLDQVSESTRTYMVGMVGPTVVASSVCALLLTSHTLPASKLSWIYALLTRLRRHDPLTTLSTITKDADYGRDLVLHKVNQFGRGEPNFNLMSIWLIVLPTVVGMLGYIPQCLTWAQDDAAAAAEEEGTSTVDSNEVMKLRIEYISYTFGWMSTLCLTFFLIPVTRHSVLLAAMGWSPIHALRIHIWMGYTSFICMLLHGILLVPVWFLYYDYPVWQQIVPNRKCWTFVWTDETMEEVQPDCYHVYANWTGIVAAVFYIVLWGSSLNWVRRRNYRLFYILHMVFGTLTILGIILHMSWVLIYLIPSITYYFASSAPTLLQALASRVRGGVAMRRVVTVPDSGGCVEVHLEAHETARAVMEQEPRCFVKICVPQISLIWHPFDVYTIPPSPTPQGINKMTSSTTTTVVRFLFRPVGPFTKELAERLTMMMTTSASDTTHKPGPVTMLVDGLYRGADKCEQALQHDCVTLVAGGVAITPYLGLLPVLFRRLVVVPAETKTTKTIALHWVCRESGLCTFVVQNYLHPILEQAKACRAQRPDVHIIVNVYVTGSNTNSGTKKKIDSVTKTTSSLPSSNDKSVTSETSSRMVFPSPPETKMSKDQVNITEAEAEAEPTEVVNKESLDGKNLKGTMASNVGSDDTMDASSSGKDESVGDNNSKDTMMDETMMSAGHSLEVARMLPRRYANMIWNLPFFVAFAGASWLGFWYILPYDSYHAHSYYDLASMTWITLYLVLMYVAYGIVAEATVLGLRKYWPQPNLQHEFLMSTSNTSQELVMSVLKEDFIEMAVDDDDHIDGNVSLSTTGSLVSDVAIVYHFSRPTESQIFEEARLASAPGIFMCGPTSLTSMVKMEARKENSYLGLTRYCLYEESYEM